MSEIRIIRWLKPEGALVQRGEVFCLIGSASGPGVMPYVEQELEAWKGGVLRRLKEEGAVVHCPGEDFFRIDPA
jgi:hypothetical protein